MNGLLDRERSSGSQPRALRRAQTQLDQVNESVPADGSGVVDGTAGEVDR
jgi:hypothetical protein